MKGNCRAAKMPWTLHSILGYCWLDQTLPPMAPLQIFLAVYLRYQDEDSGASHPGFSLWRRTCVPLEHKNYTNKMKNVHVLWLTLTGQKLLPQGEKLLSHMMSKDVQFEGQPLLLRAFLLQPCSSRICEKRSLRTVFSNLIHTIQHQILFGCGEVASRILLSKKNPNRWFMHCRIAFNNEFTPFWNSVFVDKLTGEVNLHCNPSVHLGVILLVILSLLYIFSYICYSLAWLG